MHKLSLGTAQFGLNYGIANSTGRVDEFEVRNILDLAKLLGIDTLDTAVAYGESEQVLGKVGVTDWKVMTKLPSALDAVDSPSEWVGSVIDGAINRLGVSRLEAVLLHQPKELLSPIGEELYSGLNSLKMTGRVRRIGVSVYDVAELDALIPHFDFDIVQLPMNIVDARLPESGWMEKLADNSVALHVRSVFLQGLLLMDRNRRPAWFEQWQPLWDKWDDWLQANEITPLQACPCVST